MKRISSWCSTVLLLVVLSLFLVSTTTTTRSETAAGNGAVGAELCNVYQFGAKGDGITLDTAALQKAVDFCSNRPGGVVYFPPGQFLSGTLFLRSNIIVFLESKAEIIASDNQIDYPNDRDLWYLLLGQDVSNVVLTGTGTVYGQAENYVAFKTPEKWYMKSWNTTGSCLGDECRPSLIGFLNSREISISDLYIHDSAYWTVHLFNSLDVHISGLSIDNNFMIPNNDGIDIDGGANILIENCNISTGDDGICPKTNIMPLTNLTVTSCSIISKSGAIKFGSSTISDFSYCSFTNINITKSHRGLAFQMRDNGTAHHIVFKDIYVETQVYPVEWWGMGEAIYVSATPRTADTQVGTVHDVLFENIRGRAEHGVFISGVEGAIIENIWMKNVQLKVDSWTGLDAGFNDYRPGIRDLVKHDVNLVYMEYARGVVMEDCLFEWGTNHQSNWGSSLDNLPLTVTVLTFNNVTFP